MRVLGIGGSLRRDSHSRKLLVAAGEPLAADGAALELYDGLKRVPPYDEDDDHGARPAAVARLSAAVAGADAVLFSTPEYNSSIPGQLKNALDWLSRPLAESPLRGKPVAVVGASTGMFGAVWAQAELRKVLAAIGARVVDADLPVPQAQARFDERGRLADDELARRLAGVVGALVAEARPREGVEAVAEQRAAAGRPLRSPAR